MLVHNSSGAARLYLPTYLLLLVPELISVSTDKLLLQKSDCEAFKIIFRYTQKLK